jgi:hypothetical protein
MALNKDTDGLVQDKGGIDKAVTLLQGSLQKNDCI